MAAPVDLTPLETLYDATTGREMPLPPPLVAAYGPLCVPLPAERPYVVSNFVTSLDGVVSLGGPKQAGGGEISGFSVHDHFVMGLLRAVADAVVVGAGTLRASPRHLWTAAYIYPPLADGYARLRTALGKTPTPLNVIVTRRAILDLDLPVFSSGQVRTLVVTTRRGATNLGSHRLPPSVQVAVAADEGTIAPRLLLDALGCDMPRLILVEGGPHLLAGFLAEGCLDELFLTLAPQVAGRDATVERPGLVAGRLFAPATPVWGQLASVKRAGSLLFLRYAFADARHDAAPGARRVPGSGGHRPA